MQRTAFVVAAFVGAFAAVLPAQFSLVAPPGYAGTVGNSNNAYPWNRGTASMRIQFVYDSSNFTNQGVTFPVLINHLRYRPYPGTATTSWAGGFWPNVRIDMATSPLDYLSASGTFANNLGPDLTTTYNGVVAVQAGSCSGAGVLVPWHIDITLTTPFVYDPSAGDLTLDIYLDGTGWTGGSRAVDTVTANTAAPPLCTRIYDTSGITGTTGAVGVNHAPICEFGYVPANGLTPAFTATPTAGSSPLQVQFTDQSHTSDPSGITNWLWDFDNDGIFDSTAQNPIHTYSSCGDYTVTLTVVDASHPPGVLTKQNYIKVDAVTASFTHAPTGTGSYWFTDTSTPTPTSWAWDFDDDGIVDSTVQNPTYTPPQACAANVRLTVTRLCRSDSVVKPLLLSPLALTTLLTGGTGTTSATTVGNLFDVRVLASEGISVCGLTDLTYTGTGPYTVTVYVTDNSYLGKDTNAAAWRLVATGHGTMNGGTTTAPSVNLVPLDAPFYLPAGNYGLAIYHTSATGNSYLAYSSTASGPYANADLVVHPFPATVPGIARTALFGGTANSPRPWNGTLHYTKESINHVGGYGFFGPGCAGSLGVPNNVALTPMAIGTTFQAQVNHLALDLAMYWWGYSNTISAQGPLPIDLGVLGAPGCLARVSLDATVVLLGTAGTATFVFNVPNVPTILGLQFYAQGLSLDPTANALGLVATDAAGFVVGQ